jgi:membrane associated rhomboid family serine protease
MGLYDRDYGRQERTPWDRVENPRSIVITLIVINAVIFFADFILYKDVPDPQTGELVRTYYLNNWFAVEGQTLTRPWMWWQFLTYGFVHDTGGITHVLFNMFGLYVFGRDVERRMGPMEFLRFYLLAVVAGGIVGAATHLAMGQMGGTIGASGAVIATAVMFACYFPHREILLMFVFPMKAWVLAVLFVGMDMAGALGIHQSMGQASNTAFTVHLAGAFFALGYYFLGWKFAWLDLAAIADIPKRLSQRSRRMKLKLHDPDSKMEKDADDADRILAKIHEKGEASLTASERRTLERYSRRQREKRNL